MVIGCQKARNKLENFVGYPKPFFGFSAAIIAPEMKEIFLRNVRFFRHFGKFSFFYPVGRGILA